MSFQHFRLGQLTMNQPLPPHLMGAAPQNPSQFSPTDNNSFVSNHTTLSSSSGSKAPYGSGDTDDGYTLTFSTLQAFNEWREKEEETQMVEFVKGDTHGSKAVPPRFKDHTKLVCARHSRSGRKKYVKKHPERIRKVPSRKLEGTGCPASISFKTYFDTEEVRVCYISQHSHEIGHANLPFTRRGRKQALIHDKDRPRKHTKYTHDDNSISVSGPVQSESVAGTSTQFSAAVSMLAPLPQTPQYTATAQPYGYPPQPQFSVDPSSMSPDRWDNMSTLFQSVRDHARGYEYPPASVAALESCLIRLFLESPVSVPPTQGVIPGAVMQQHHHQHPQQHQAPSTQPTGGSSDGSASDDSSQ